MKTCDTPYCPRLIPSARLKRATKEGYHFCDRCRGEHSYRVLVAQTQHGMPIKELLLEASSFQSAGSMADYVGVSFVTVYHWILRYYDMSFQEFRRRYICKKSSRGQCYHLDLGRSTYSRNDYVVKKIKAKRYCACLNALERNLIMTNAPLQVMQSVLRGKPRIEKISDDVFALVPDPIMFILEHPVYLDLHQGVPAKKVKKAKQRDQVPKKRPPRIPGTLKFREKVLTALHALGGSSTVDRIRFSILTCEGEHPRANNTRRLLYQHAALFRLSPDDSKVIELTDFGIQVAEALIKASEVGGGPAVVKEDTKFKKSKGPVV